MYAAAHAGVAAVAAKRLGVSRLTLALTVGWLSHYAVDAVPHGDTVPASATVEERQEWRERSLNLALVDLGLLAWLWVRRTRRHGLSWTMTAAMVGSVGPDALNILEQAIGFRFLWGWPNTVHAACHNPLHIVIPWWIGLLLQAAFVAACWWWLFRQPPPVFREPG